MLIIITIIICIIANNVHCLYLITQHLLFSNYFTFIHSLRYIIKPDSIKENILDYRTP